MERRKPQAREISTFARQAVAYLQANVIDKLRNQFTEPAKGLRTSAQFLDHLKCTCTKILEMLVWVKCVFPMGHNSRNLASPRSTAALHALPHVMHRGLGRGHSPQQKHHPRVLYGTRGVHRHDTQCSYPRRRAPREPLGGGAQGRKYLLSNVKAILPMRSGDCKMLDEFLIQRNNAT